MAQEDFELLLANVRDFDWNPSKRDQVFRVRHIAFEATDQCGAVRSERRSPLHGVRASGDVEVVIRLHVPQRHLLDYFGETGETR
jgi:hypothetical protein